MSRPSRSCFRRGGDVPLREYASESEAKGGAQYVRKTHGEEHHPYRCEACDLWHLSPRKPKRRLDTCTECCSQAGRPKVIYPSKALAKEQAKRVHDESDLRLRRYRCPSGLGWHLTKAPARNVLQHIAHGWDWLWM